MIVKKQWYVVYRDGFVLNSGSSTGLKVNSGNTPCAEFDTEAEMEQFIADNNLQEREDEELA
jgi:hypothetical protein